MAAKKRERRKGSASRRKDPFEARTKPRVDLRLALGSITEVDVPAVVLGLFQGVPQLSQAARAIDERMGGAITEILERRMFLGKVGEIFILPAVRHDIRADLVVCAGMGSFGTFDPAVLQIVAENVARTMMRAKVTDFATVLFGASRGKLYSGLAHLVDGYFRGVRGAPTHTPLRSITVCETDRLRSATIEKALGELYGTKRSEHVEVTLEKITLPAPARAVSEQGDSAVILQTTQIPSGDDAKTTIRFSILAGGAKAAILSDTRTIDTRKLEKLVAEVNQDEFLYGDTLARLKSYGRRVAKALVPPKIATALKKVVGKRRLVMVQDRGTSVVPWETLCFENWFPAAEGGMSRQYVADDMPVARWLEQRRFGENLEVLLIINPTRDLDGAEEEGDILQAATKPLSGLNITELRGGRATKARVKQSLASGKFDVLHYAGHTAFWPDNPLETGIVCADGTLAGGELRTIGDLPALVLFNSCESARVGGLTQIGSSGIERNIGLAEAFLRGGIANYVGTHWEVSDAAAPSFMTTFYRALLNGEPIGDAVAAGRKAVRKLKSRDWADYIHYGSPSFVLKVPYGTDGR